MYRLPRQICFSAAKGLIIWLYKSSTQRLAAIDTFSITYYINCKSGKTEQLSDIINLIFPAPSSLFLYDHTHLIFDCFSQVLHRKRICESHCCTSKISSPRAQFVGWRWGASCCRQTANAEKTRRLRTPLSTLKKGRWWMGFSICWSGNKICSGNILNLFHFENKTKTNSY